MEILTLNFSQLFEYLQWIQFYQANQLYYVNTSRCKGTENYPPRGGGWLVEAGKAVETAVGITVASDDDTSVVV